MQENNSGELVSIYTLVDITHTEDNNPKGTTHSFKQEQNFNTILQVMSLRTQVVVESLDHYTTESIQFYEFGSNYKGLHDVWILKIKSETTDIWKDNSDSLFYASHDCDGVPIYTGLGETVDMLPLISVYDINQKNMYFKLGDKNT
jgi:hypothetical protein